MPIVDRVLAQPSVGPATSVIDVGCGPGVVAVHIAVSLPAASVVAVDTSEALLARVERRAADVGVGARVRTVVADLEHALPDLPPADLVWASMVLHHVPDPVVTLRHLRDWLRPGGSLVMVEFGSPPTVLPADGPLVVDGTWQRFVSASAASLNERLGLDPSHRRDRARDARRCRADTQRSLRASRAPGADRLPPLTRPGRRELRLSS